MAVVWFSSQTPASVAVNMHDVANIQGTSPWAKANNAAVFAAIKAMAIHLFLFRNLIKKPPRKEIINGQKLASTITASITTTPFAMFSCSAMPPHITSIAKMMAMVAEIHFFAKF